MTAILAVKRDGQIWVASDSVTFSGSRKMKSAPKFSEFRGAMIGSAGCLGVVQLVMNRANEFKKPKFWDEKAVHRFGTFMKKCAEERGAPKEGKDGDLPSHGVRMILVGSGRIFHVFGNSSFLEFDRFTAEGAGRSYCLGALEVLWDTKMPLKAVAKLAVEAAKTHCADVAGETQLWNCGSYPTKLPATASRSEESKAI